MKFHLEIALSKMIFLIIKILLIAIDSIQIFVIPSNLFSLRVLPNLKMIALISISIESF